MPSDWHAEHMIAAVAIKNKFFMYKSLGRAI
jgi:hypothetical protein